MSGTVLEIWKQIIYGGANGQKKIIPVLCENSGLFVYGEIWTSKFFPFNPKAA